MEWKKRDREKVEIVLFVVFILAVLGFALYSVNTAAAEGDHCDTQSIAGIAEAVTFLIHREPGHPLRNKPERIAEISIALCDAGSRYDVDPYLLTAMAWFESTFNPAVLSLKKKGKASEKGLLQVGKEAAGTCPYFMDDVRGQALCGARWLAQAYRECGDGASDRAALAMYAEGQTCNMKGDKQLTWKVNRRIRLRDRLKNMVLGR